MENKIFRTKENASQKNWSASYSLWTYHLDLSCCGLEFQSALGPRYDWERFGTILVDNPANADLLIVDGPVNKQSKNQVLEVYNLMRSPKFVISMGSCANSGGMFFSEDSSINCGVDSIVPVDIFVPGCPPRPEAMINALITLQNKIRETELS